MMKKQLLSLAAAAALLTAAQSSFAGSLGATPDLQYKVTLVGSCIAAATSGLSDFGTFGTLDGVQAGLPAGTVTVTCSNTLPVSVCVGGGLNYGTQTAATRSMEETLVGGSYVDYVLKNAAGGATVGDSGCDDGSGSYAESASDHAPASVLGSGAIAGPASVLTLLADVDPSSSGDVEGTFEDTVAVTVMW